MLLSVYCEAAGELVQLEDKSTARMVRGIFITGIDLQVTDSANRDNNMRGVGNVGTWPHPQRHHSERQTETARVV